MIYITRLKLIIYLMLLLSSCASWSPVGQVTKTVSPIDGRSSINLYPAIAGTGLALGLYWDSNMGENVLLKASITGAELISRTAPLILVVDGKKYNFEPARNKDFGDIESVANGTMNVTVKEYLIKKEHVAEIANGKKGAYRISLEKGKYLEDKLFFGNQDSPHMVPAAFRKFYKEAWGN